MDRLTKRISGHAHGAEGINKDKLTGVYCRGQFEATACIDKLAEYEDLEGQGKLLRLPCKVGDIVYSVNLYSGVCRHEIRNFQLDKNGQYACSNLKFPLSDFGKIVFLTKKQAESALKRLNEREAEKMRLIDAEGLLGDLKKWNGLDKTTYEAVVETIKKQPTVYNVDKVVKECEKQLEIYAKYHGEDWREEMPLVKAVKTVKEGGTLIESEDVK